MSLKRENQYPVLSFMMNVFLFELFLALICEICDDLCKDNNYKTGSEQEMMKLHFDVYNNVNNITQPRILFFECSSGL